MVRFVDYKCKSLIKLISDSHYRQIITSVIAGTRSTSTEESPCTLRNKWPHACMLVFILMFISLLLCVFLLRGWREISTSISARTQPIAILTLEWCNSHKAIHEPSVAIFICLLSTFVDLGLNFMLKALSIELYNSRFNEKTVNLIFLVSKGIEENYFLFLLELRKAFWKASSRTKLFKK